MWQTNMPRFSLVSRQWLYFLLLFLSFFFVITYLIKDSWVNSLSSFKNSLWVNSFPCKTMETFSIHHNMSDEELFLRASSLVKEDYCPVSPKIAFMFLTVGSLHFAPLWEKFFSGHEHHFSIYIHSSPSFRPDYHPSSLFYRRQIPSKVSEWGKLSLCDAERRLLANAMMDIANERFILLSEACIPIHNFTTIHSYIMNSRYSFVDSFDGPGPDERGRYDVNLLPEVNVTQWRKGSQWFEVNRHLAHLIIQDKKYYPKFSEYDKTHRNSEEHYLQTMLSIQAGLMLANRSLTWADWSRGGSHPATFGGSDITEDLFNSVHENKNCEYNDMPDSVCFLFARKFSPDALENLLLLSPKLLLF